MFVVGVVGVVGVIGRSVLHDDWSDRSWKDHHQYKDASVIADIKKKKEMILSEERALENMKKRLREQLEENISAVATNEEIAAALQKLGLHDEGKLAEAAMQGTRDISEKVKKEIIGTIKEDIDHDQQCLDKINEAIFKLNEYKLR